MVATSILPLGVNTPAHIKGTKYFDALSMVIKHLAHMIAATLLYQYPQGLMQ